MSEDTGSVDLIVSMVVAVVVDVAVPTGSFEGWTFPV